MPDPSDDAVAWDRFVRGASIGAASVLILFLAITGLVYFTSDYEFRTVSEPDDAPTAAPPTLDGEAITKSTGCVACHSVDGSEGVGPTWLGLAGHEVELEDGSVVVADTEYIRNSIVDPKSQVVAGFNPLMPEVYSDILSSDEIDAVVAYIESLGG